MPYFIEIETYGGLVYGQELETAEYHFWQRSKEPVGLKKEGYYIEGYYKDKKMTERYEFGSTIWNSLKLYVNWQPGYAVKLNYADGEEEWSNAGIDYIKTYHEQYVKPGSKYTLHKVYNDIPYSGVGIDHYNEQLLWFDNKACTGDPFDIRTFEVNGNINLYGKWFDTDKSKFDVDSGGTLNKYLGNCKRIILPSNVIKIKDTDYSKFTVGSSGQLYDNDGKVYSAFENVMDDLEIIYINKECEELGECAFRQCNQLEKVYFLGENLITIGKGAFSQCIALSTITLPNGVAYIGERAFEQTDALREIGGMENVIEIGDCAFMTSKIKTITLDSVRSIGKNAFAFCLNLKALVLNTNWVVSTNVVKPTGTDDDNILHASDDAKIYVKGDFVNKYKSTSPWSAYASKILSISDLA